MNFDLVITDAEVDGRRVDIGIGDGRITIVGERGGLRPRVGREVIDAGGGALIAGLHDHHLHLLAMGAARTSVDVAPPNVVSAAQARDVLRRADAKLPPGEWLRAVHYHESVAGDIDRMWLDDVVPSRPVRVQHRSGACWIVNSVAADRLALAECSLAGIERDERGQPTGRLFGLDDWLGERVPRRDIAPDVVAAAHELASYGITAVTDATPSERADELTVLAGAVALPDFPLTVTITGGPALPVDASRSLARGPVKIVLADHALPGLDDIVAAFRAARRQGRNVAVHCVTAVALVLAMAAWDEAGVVDGDRIEHGAVIPIELIDALVARRLTVVTSPRFIHDRGDTYRDEIAVDEHDDLWRCGSLLDAGVPVAGSSDAPFGSPDPWQAMATATERRTRSGDVLGAAETIDGRRALALYLGPLSCPGGVPRHVAAGAPADLCLLDVSLADALADLNARHVALTVAGGRITYRA